MERDPKQDWSAFVALQGRFWSAKSARAGVRPFHLVASSKSKSLGL